MEAIIGLIFGILIGAVFSGAIIWLIGKMNLGLSVDNFGWAMLAGLFKAARAGGVVFSQIGTAFAVRLGH